MMKNQQDGELKIRELELRAQISQDNMRLMQKHHAENILLKLKEIQAHYDAKHWQGILSREETADILRQGQDENRFLLLLSSPDVTPTCPETLRHDLEKTLRSKVKEFVETYYPRHSPHPVQFFGKFFKSSIFDTEAAQLEKLLAPVPTAVIFSDLTNKELLLHIHVWGIGDGKLSQSSAFAWKSEYKKLLAAGLDEEDALDEIQNAIVQTHKLLGGFLADLYFLHINPLHEPRLFGIDRVDYPPALTAQLFVELQSAQQQRRADYDELLESKLANQSMAPQPDLPGFKNLAGLEEDTEAQYQRGMTYYMGEDVPRDYYEAVAWFRNAAEQGHAEAQFWLGRTYLSGLGISQDESEAMVWIQRAAEQGHTDAQQFLGYCYEEGLGVSKSNLKSAYWYYKAVSSYQEKAEQGDAKAQCALGYIEVVKKNRPTQLSSFQ